MGKKRLWGAVRDRRRLLFISRIVGVTSIGIAGFVVAGQGAQSAAATTKPQSGGNITVPQIWSTLDPANPQFSISDTQPAFSIFDSLFIYEQQSGYHLNSKTNIHALYKPELATNFAYSNNFKTLTIQLRHGVKFQDNTPFNAAAVRFNLLRYQSSGGVGAPDMNGVTSITTKGNYTVILHSNVPNANLLQSIVGETDGFMASPTAIASEGPTEFSVMPVGAGGYTVQSNNVGVTLVLQRWPGYWNAKHTYLQTITMSEGPEIAGDSVEMADLESGALAGFWDLSYTPNVLSTGLANPNIDHLVGPTTQFHFINFNTFRAPFNNPLAREAVFDCTDQVTLERTIYGSFGDPAYIMAGTGSLYYPTDGAKPPPGFDSYDPSKAEALVKQLGGLSFTLVTGTSPAGQTPDEALQAMWDSCGMTVTLSPESTALSTENRINGTEQLIYNMNGDQGDPYSTIGLYTLAGEGSYNISGVFGSSNVTLERLETATNDTANYAVLAKLWARIYHTIDAQTLAVPLNAYPGIYFFAKDLHGAYPWGPGIIFTNAWLST